MGLFKYLKEKFKKNDDKKGESSSEQPKKDSHIQDKDKYVAGLEKSRQGFSSKLKKLSAKFKKVDASYFDELEEILIEADVGVDLTLELIDETVKESKLQNIDDPEKTNEILVDKMFIGYANKGGSFKTDLDFVQGRPTVLMMVGVNGGGKTTTIAKLAKRYIDRGKKVLLVAADTFRAGAVEQLAVWANRLNTEIVMGPENGDPASVCYDGAKKAVEGNYDLVIVDTAGRLQNKSNLMAELAKMKRVISKVIPDAPDDVFLVLDANTGQNGVIQAKVFKECTNLTGVVITKMDGTSKGGIILSIRDELNVPVRFIGLGEKMEDLKEFDLDNYLYGLLIGEEE